MEPQRPAATSSSSWLESGLPDPVFEGMVKDFGHFDEALQGISGQIEPFLDSIQGLCDSLHGLSDSLPADLSRAADMGIVTDCHRLRQATKQIVHPDAPFSSLARLKRNLDFNVVKPLEKHLSNNEKLRTELEKRERRLEELRSASRQIQECRRLELSEGDRRLHMAQAELALSQRYFKRQDKQVFEWLYELELHRNDILESCVQTLQHLQYDFFAASAHALAAVLPPRMAFRPLAEMSPDCLQAQVELELAQDDGEEAFTQRMLGRLVARDDSTPAPLPADLLSLSALMAQGFDETRARRALRLHGNDTQAALDWLLYGDAGEAVRMPKARAPLGKAHVETGGPEPQGIGMSVE